MTRRVVVTGLGCITPLGTDVDTLWNNVKEGNSAVGNISIFDATKFPTKIAAEVRNWDVTQIGEEAEVWKNRSRHSGFAVGAAKQAIDSSGIQDCDIDRTRFGLYLGCGEGFQDFNDFNSMVAGAITEEGLDIAEFMNVGFQRLNFEYEWEQEPNMPIAHVAGMFNIQGPVANTQTACAASNQAVGEATEMIRRNAADVMLAGGAHSMIHPFGLTGFNLLTALSTNNENATGASRPFDRLRDGFVLGEGSSMMVLEELEHAKARGAQIYGEILGYGSTADAYRVTDQHPDGRGAVGCMTRAIKNAGIDPSDIDYVNAHGTSTPVNDKVETKSCKNVFGEDAPPISSTKSMMGHLITAAGATELMVCLLAINENVLPPTINYENPDPECDLDYVPNEAREAECNMVLNNSFGFGGQNVSMVVGQFTG